LIKENAGNNETGYIDVEMLISAHQYSLWLFAGE
jgi:hypothetical protein